MVDILKVTDPIDVFPNQEKITEVFRDLAKQCHPDSPTGSEEKMIKLQELYTKAKELKKSGRYVKSNQLIFSDYGTGKKEFFNIMLEFPWSLGTAYQCEKEIVYAVSGAESKDGFDILKLFEYFNFDRLNFNLNGKSLTYRHLFPRTTVLGNCSTIKTSNESCVLIKNVPERTFSIIDFVNQKEKFKPEKYFHHIEWIITKLYDLECFLHYNNISHNAFLLENLFLNFDKKEVLKLVT